MNECIHCGEEFEPWRDEWGDWEYEMCRNCAFDYEEGQDEESYRERTKD